MRWSKKLRTTRSAKRKMPVVVDFRTRMRAFSGPPSWGSPRGYRRGSPRRWPGRRPAAPGCRGPRPRRLPGAPGLPRGWGSPRLPALRPGWTPRSRSSRRDPVAFPGGPFPGNGGVQLAPYAVGEVLGLLRGAPETCKGLARQLQASLELWLYRLVDAQAAEVLQLPGVLRPDQEVGIRSQATHAFDGEPGRQGAGDGQHHEARPTDPGGFEDGYGHGVAVDRGEPGLPGLIGPARIGLDDDERLVEPAEQPGDEGTNPSVPGDDGVVPEPSSRQIEGL